MAKSKFFRVAVSGTTVDGRVIEPKHLTEMAETYNPETYAARGNLEHFRGVTGAPPFTALADVLALKTQEDEFEIGGKKEKRLALYAQIEPTSDLIELNKKKQKLYTSIEIMPDFAKGGKAYLMGLAFTDSPASLGTERLEFTQRAAAYGNWVTEPQETNFAVEEEVESDSQKAAVTAFAAVTNFFSQFTNTPKTEPTPAPAAPPAQIPAVTDLAFGQQFMTGLMTLSAAVEASAKVNAESVALLTKAVEANAADVAALKTTLGTTPAKTFTPRPVHSGGAGHAVAEC